MNSLFAPNFTQFEKTLARQFLTSALPESIPELWNPNTCPPALLPWLAWSLSVDDWDPNWSVAVRRAQIKSSVSIHRKKGTSAAVRAAVAAFGADILIKEWWENSPPATPHTFTLLLGVSENGGAPSQSFVNSVVAAVENAKPLRSHFTFLLTATATAAMGMVAVARSIIFARVDAVAMPLGGENLVYLTDQDGHFLTDQFGHLLVQN
ncbi:MAG: phage tail protein P2 protein I family [Hyphomonadaceae bacterium]|nr:MAG: phage tail protein P2 protein I family [Hyphomonadaceae bacterium]